MDRIAWVKDLDSPENPGTHLIGNTAVTVREFDIKRAKERLADGYLEVVFAAVRVTNIGNEGPSYCLGAMQR